MMMIDVTLCEVPINNRALTQAQLSEIETEHYVNLHRFATPDEYPQATENNDEDMSTSLIAPPPRLISLHVLNVQLNRRLFLNYNRREDQYTNGHVEDYYVLDRLRTSRRIFSDNQTRIWSIAPTTVNTNHPSPHFHGPTFVIITRNHPSLWDSNYVFRHSMSGAGRFNIDLDDYTPAEVSLHVLGDSVVYFPNRFIVELIRIMGIGFTDND